MSKLQLYLGTDKVRVDTLNIDYIPISFSLKDIKNYGKRNSSFTKPITVLRTGQSELIFKGLNNIGISGGFDVGAKVRAIIDDGTSVLLNGYAQVTDILSDRYEIVVYENTVGLLSDIGDKYVIGNVDASLDITLYDPADASVDPFSHTPSRVTIAQELSKTPSFDGTGYAYGIIDYDNTIISKYSVKNDYNVLPSLAFKQLFDEIVTQNGYSYELSSDIEYWMDRMYMPMNDSLDKTTSKWDLLRMRLGTLAKTRECTETGSSQYFIRNNGENTVPHPYNSNVPHGALEGMEVSTNDYNNQYDLSIGWKSTAYGHTILSNGKYDVSVGLLVTTSPIYGGDYIFDTPPYDFTPGEPLDTVWSLVVKYGTDYATYDLGTLDASGLDNDFALTKYQGFALKDIEIKGGSTVYVCLEYPSDGESSRQAQIALLDPSTYLKMVKSNSVISSSYTYESFLPVKTKQSDIVNDVFKMFNAYVQTDKYDDKHLIISSYDSFFANNVTWDWTDKIDAASIKFSPIKNTLAKTISFTQVKDADIYSEDYYYKLKHPIYHKEYNSDSEFNTTTESIDLGFSGTALKNIADDLYVSVISDGVTFKTDWNRRLLFFNSEDASYVYGANLNDASFNCSKWNTLSPRLNNNISDPSNGLLGFNSRYTYNTDGVETSKNLYDVFYKKELESLMDDGCYLLEADFLLSANDIAKVAFNDYIFINNLKIGNALYRLNAIKDFKGNGELTAVELIKMPVYSVTTDISTVTDVLTRTYTTSSTTSSGGSSTSASSDATDLSGYAQITYVDASLTARDASISYLYGVSIGASKGYVDGSLATRDASISYLYANKADKSYVDASLNAKLDKEIATNTHFTTGFVNRTDSVLTFDSSTRVVSVLPASSTFDIYSDGTKIVLGTGCVKTIANTTGMHYIYFDTNGSLNESTSAWTIVSSNVPACTVYWNGTIGAISEERHSAGRNLEWHQWAHDTVGTRYESGLFGAFSSSSTNIGGGYIHDEDIDLYIPAQTNVKLWYRTGVGGTSMTFDISTSSICAKVLTGVLQFDDAGVISPVTNLGYIKNYVFATPDVSVPIMCYIGQTEYLGGGALEACRAEALPVFPNVPNAELKLIYTTIWRNFGGTPTFIESEDYRDVTSLPGGAITTISAAGVTFVPTGTIESTNVQSAIAELDASVGFWKEYTDGSLSSLSTRVTKTDASLYTLLGRHNFTETSLYTLTNRHNFTETSLYNTSSSLTKTDASLYDVFKNYASNASVNSALDGYVEFSTYNSSIANINSSFGLYVTFARYNASIGALEYDQSKIDASLYALTTRLNKTEPSLYITSSSLTKTDASLYIIRTSLTKTDASVYDIFKNYASNASVNAAITANTLIGLTSTNITRLGVNAGNSTFSGGDNVIVGIDCASSLSSGAGNTILGNLAGEKLKGGFNNVIVGHQAGQDSSGGYYNVFVGAGAGMRDYNGYGNTFLGYAAGVDNSTGGYNVFLGHFAGRFELGSNKLYIDNQNRISDASAQIASLVVGTFANDPADQVINFNAEIQQYGVAISSGSVNSSIGEITSMLNKTDASLYVLTGRVNKTEASVYLLDVEINKTDASLYIIRTSLSKTDASLYDVFKNYASNSSVNTALDQYLPLDGGTMSGDITFDTSFAYDIGSYASPAGAIFSANYISKANDPEGGHVRYFGFTDDGGNNVKAEFGTYFADGSIGYMFIGRAYNDYNIRMYLDGATELTYDDVEKLSTESYGVSITGDMTVSGDASIVGTIYQGLYNVANNASFGLYPTWTNVNASFGNIISRHNFTEASLYLIDGEINKTDASLYIIRTSLTKTDASVYDIFKNYASNSSVNNLGSSLTKTDASLYIIRTSLTKTDASLYTISTSLTKTDASVYSIFKAYATNTSVGTMWTNINASFGAWTKFSLFNSSINNLNASLGLYAPLTGANFSGFVKVGTDASITGNLYVNSSLMRVGSGGTFAGSLVQIPHLVKKVASANLRNSHDAEATTALTAYTKLKTYTIPYGLLGQVRVDFDIHTDSGSTDYARVYKNGVALGTEQSTTSLSYVTKTENITSNYSPGDTCELWGKAAVGDAVYVRNFRLYYDDSPTVAVTTIIS